MKSAIKRTVVAVAMMGLAGSLSPGWAQDAADPIDSEADKVIRSMSAFLAKQSSFSFETEVLYELVYGGEDGDWDVEAEKVTVARTGKAVVRRPDRFVVKIDETGNRKEYYYDGKSFVISDPDANVFVKKSAPGTIDQTIALLRDTYESDPPLSDLLESDLYKSHMDGVEAASYLGKTRLRGKDVHHIAFASRGMDWQVWIADGDQPLPVMLQILQRDEMFWPSYQAWFTKWEFGQDAPDGMFVFEEPKDAMETQFVEDAKFEQSEAAQ
jgi:hypothetical protein